LRHGQAESGEDADDHDDDRDDGGEDGAVDARLGRRGGCRGRRDVVGAGGSCRNRGLSGGRLRRRRLDGHLLRFHLGARPRVGHAVDDHAGVRLQSLDRPEVAVDVAAANVRVMHDVVGRHREHELLRKVGPDGGLGDEHCAVGLAGVNPHAGEEAGE
jgi:hypothetical protein